MKRRGFSLMEMMVVLLITSVVAAATAPMISKKMQSSSQEALESPWRWMQVGKGDKHAVLNPKGDNYSAVIGANSSKINRVNMYPRLFIKTNDISTDQILLNDRDKLTWRLNAMNDGISFTTVDERPSDNSVTIGKSTTPKGRSVIIGSFAEGGKDGYSTAIGGAALATGEQCAIAIGNNAKALLSSLYI